MKRLAEKTIFVNSFSSFFMKKKKKLLKGAKKLA
jgi:hypothetical protein